MDSSMDEEEFYEEEINGRGIAILSISSAVLLWVGFFLYYFSFRAFDNLSHSLTAHLFFSHTPDSYCHGNGSEEGKLSHMGEIFPAAEHSYNRYLGNPSYHSPNRPFLPRV